MDIDFSFKCLNSADLAHSTLFSDQRSYLLAAQYSYVSLLQQNTCLCQIMIATSFLLLLLIIGAYLINLFEIANAVIRFRTKTAYFYLHLDA